MTNKAVAKASTPSTVVEAKTSSETESDYEEAPQEVIEERRKPMPLRRPSELTSAGDEPVNGSADAIRFQESPPHIVDHCYAKPSSASREEEEKTLKTLEFRPFQFQEKEYSLFNSLDQSLQLF